MVAVVTASLVINLEGPTRLPPVVWESLKEAWEQLEFWAKVGRAALDNPDLQASFIAESLMSLAEPRDDSAPFVPRSHSSLPA